jgi:hypothetical protein
MSVLDRLAKVVLVLCGLTLVLGLLAFAAISQSTSDVLWKEAYSPDRTWSVHVYWHHESRMPASFHVLFDLVVRNSDGRVVLRRELGEAEVYTDIANDFAPVTCTNDHAKIGDIRLSKADALPVNHWGSKVQYPILP